MVLERVYGGYGTTSALVIRPAPEWTPTSQRSRDEASEWLWELGMQREEEGCCSFSRSLSLSCRVSLQLSQQGLPIFFSLLFLPGLDGEDLCSLLRNPIIKIN